MAERCCTAGHSTKQSLKVGKIGPDRLPRNIVGKTGRQTPERLRAWRKVLASCQAGVDWAGAIS
jgi:hypothetical protein